MVSVPDYGSCSNTLASQVSKQFIIWHSAHDIYFSFKRTRASQVSKQFIIQHSAHMALCSHFRSVKFKGLPACDDASNSERTSFEKKNLLKSSEHFTSASYGFHFWIESQSVRMKFIYSSFKCNWIGVAKISRFLQSIFFGFVFANQPSGFLLYLRFALQHQFSFRFFLNLLFQYVE